MFLYILDLSKNDFVESETLYPHDIALLIDNEEKKVYFYSGVKSKEREQKIGIDLASKIINKFKMFEFVLLDSVIPLKVQAEIDEMIIGEDTIIKIERTFPMQISIYFGIGILILSFLIPILGFSIFGWEKPEIILYSVTASQFTSYFDRLIIITWIWFGITCVQLACTIWSQKIYLVVCSLSSTIITLGLVLYMNQRNFIFEFQPGSIESSLYLIQRYEIILFWIWILLGSIGIFLSSFISVFTIFKHSEIVEKEEVDAEKIRLKSRPTILRDKPPVELKEIEPTE
ncbi:hypothetical protein DSAG12_00505 [Promethearchaeum syntrophicum]|uniref:Uncharacterized protein n=1 Tax=Promethearchaeum syntrophicum TaxID=2594042 RepID=A0A5B9D6M6_9ARCH|nr:hypothetical protein [Candidatus Prometheoarchaeum syntrophicum]QEE14692.1 hypothetical protein DSAG12_00505 [Candidatus Prometheoarchaeum syntrophicum]